ncbi:MAG: hypothetical protein SPG54_02890 [Sodaliphilus sp.]|nr:hypothetical protein [Sodaliphilus sp.]
MKKYMKSLLLAALAVVAAMGFTACSDDDKFTGDPYFTLEGLENMTYDFNYEAVDTLAYSEAKKIVVRSNRPWKLVCQSENGWCRVFPTEGEGDGIIRLSTVENKKPDTRDMVYKIYLDGVEQPVPLTIRQTGSEPYIKPSANSITIAREGGAIPFSVLTNVPYTYEVRPVKEGDDVSWITVTPSETDPNSVMLNCVASNKDRFAVLHIQGTGNYTDLSIDIPVTQLGALFFENFSWMNHSDTSILGWVTDGESNSRFDKWTDEELSHGWTSRNNLCYGRPGFLKLGKTGYGGDLVSPKIPEIGSGMDIAVSMQLVGYCTQAGTLDDVQVYVGVLGPGKVTKIIGGNGGEIVNGVLYCDENKAQIVLNDVASFMLTDDNHFNYTTDPDGLLVWENPNTNYTIYVDGATSDTQIVILGGAFDVQLKTIGKGKNRIFIDNFKVEGR